MSTKKTDFRAMMNDLVDAEKEGRLYVVLIQQEGKEVLMYRPDTNMSNAEFLLVLTSSFEGRKN